MYPQEFVNLLGDGYMDYGLLHSLYSVIKTVLVGGCNSRLHLRCWPLTKKPTAPPKAHLSQRETLRVIRRGNYNDRQLSPRENLCPHFNVQGEFKILVIDVSADKGGQDEGQGRGGGDEEDKMYSVHSVNFQLVLALSCRARMENYDEKISMN